ncbi:hypothetical protein, partial [Akkermansia sp.]|uniref:hypothetical protein n=1 Tax=Akkermansia sp. TaxID=1872421 RepID=UPI003AB2DF9D
FYIIPLIFNRCKPIGLQRFLLYLQRKKLFVKNIKDRFLGSHNGWLFIFHSGNASKVCTR